MLTDYEAVVQLILAESTITTLLGVFYNGSTATVQPLVVSGTIDEGQKDLPAISVRNGLQTGDFGISFNFIEVHCYASTETESREVAQAVYDYFRNSVGSITASGESWSGRINASILTTTPSDAQTNTIVELKLDYR